MDPSTGRANLTSIGPVSSPAGSGNPSFAALRDDAEQIIRSWDTHERARGGRSVIDWFTALADTADEATVGQVLRGTFERPLSPTDLSNLWTAGPKIGAE